jgi:hypothetical protein
MITFNVETIAAIAAGIVAVIGAVVALVIAIKHKSGS